MIELITPSRLCLMHLYNNIIYLIEIAEIYIILIRRLHGIK